MARFGFVADDLTGAGDVLAQAHQHGLDAVLAIGDVSLPTDVDVVGIAGPARSLGGREFDELVTRDLRRIAAVDLDVLLYKVCSTFDSSPTIGSIGRGIELLHQQFPAHGPIPVAPAQPGFGRYTAFSQHFAVSGEEIYRLDRHPVMSTHPSTPMSESDLRLVLAGQLRSSAQPGFLHLPKYTSGEFETAWKGLRADPSAAAFVVDAVDDTHLDAVASALRGARVGDGPSLVVGSGGMMAALARSMNQPAPTRDESSASGPVLVVSASASSVTARQLADARGAGWVDVPVPAAMLHTTSETDRKDVETAVAQALTAGKNVLVHTTLGADDPRYSQTHPVSAQHVGTLIGTLAAHMAQRGLTRDIAVFGGDTSSHALIAMGVSYLRVSQQFVTAGPICRSDDAAAVAGCRLLLKGGQVGPVDILRRFAAPEPA
ncbi:four-carbon acid sugar kinase family protein [Rhodococcus sp. Eu-32]|uniref:four-carbon acid sugar kinase family protein n=1 Tax=Rhodococcus sp. Eu-32 TaxID=1017319 RepID=UPI000DF4ACD9|nr:four-carbon acid sugar kinase family protein [Rhodococcus sp. Eu-32]RRQ24986.1 four-carbon acid sugar kinase family protein [Rhodococcus sp. Eu-32]